MTGLTCFTITTGNRNDAVSNEQFRQVLKLKQLIQIQWILAAYFVTSVNLILRARVQNLLSGMNTEAEKEWLMEHNVSCVCKTCVWCVSQDWCSG